MNNPREKWYELASPHIDLIANEGIFRKSIVDGWEFAFIPEELKVDYKWKFNIGDIVTTDGIDRKIIEKLPPLDPRRDYFKEKNDFYALDIIADKYYVIDLDKDGNKIELDPDEWYSPEYNTFNENEISYLDDPNDVIKYRTLERELSFGDRDQWYDKLSPLITSIENDGENRQSYLYGMPVQFLPEELKPDYQWKFSIGDIVTDGYDKFVIIDMPLLCSRWEGYEAGDIFSCGNTYMLKTIGEDGSDVLSYNFIDNAYVVDIKYRNENELEKVEE